MPTNGFSTKPLKVKLLAGEQKATEIWFLSFGDLFSGSRVVSIEPTQSEICRGSGQPR